MSNEEYKKNQKELKENNSKEVLSNDADNVVIVGDDKDLKRVIEWINQPVETTDLENSKLLKKLLERKTTINRVKGEEETFKK